MKTVSGEVVSTKPVSLSKAARILSNFASSDNGASPAFAAYLKRASASFDELAQLHKKYKTSGDKQEVKNSVESTKLQEVNTKVKSNNSVTNHDEIEKKEHLRVNKVKGEAERKSVGLEVEKEHLRVNKVKGEAERKSVSLKVDEEEMHKSKKRVKDEEERHKSKKRIKDEEKMIKDEEKMIKDEEKRHQSKKSKDDEEKRHKNK